MTIAKTASPQAIDLRKIEDELRPLSTDKLRSTFVESFGKAAEFIARAAICVKLMEERGESLKGLPQVSILRKIASGQVLPEVAWTFAESPGRNDVLAAPMPDQVRLSKNPIVPVVEKGSNGGMTTRMMDLTSAPKETVKLVLGPDGLRTPEEQIAVLTSRKYQAAKPQAAPEVAESEPLTRSITLKLTETEYFDLVASAAELRKTPAELARRGLLKSGVIKERKK